MRQGETPQGEAEHEVETLQRNGKRELDALPPEGWRKPEVLRQQGDDEVDVLPHGSPNEGKCGDGRKAFNACHQSAPLPHESWGRLNFVPALIQSLVPTPVFALIRAPLRRHIDFTLILLRPHLWSAFCSPGERDVE